MITETMTAAEARVLRADAERVHAQQQTDQQDARDDQAAAA